MEYLDSLDQEILKLLEENSRYSNSEIARKTGVSEGTIRNRIRRLIREGYIAKFTITRGFAGTSAIILVKVDPKKSQETMKRLRERFTDIYEISGKYDLSIQVECGGTEELNRIIDEIRGMEGVRSTDSMIRLSLIRDTGGKRI